MTIAPRHGAAPVPRSRTAGRVLLDTGVLVAIHARDDSRHAAAVRWMVGCGSELHTTESVLTEAAYFLPARSKHLLADLAAHGAIAVHQPDAAGYGRISALLRKYADVDPDWADIELVWLAEATGINRIATLDVADFSVYRIHGRKRFELELLR